MFKRKKFLIGGLIIFLAIAYLAYTGFQGSATYYYTVSEFAGQGSAAQGQNVRVNGEVSGSSLEKDSGDRRLQFTLAEGPDTLAVIYRGAVPDAFQDGIDVVVEGSLAQSGVFEADNIMVKCPSKYAAENG